VGPAAVSGDILKEAASQRARRQANWHGALGGCGGLLQCFITKECVPGEDTACVKCGENQALVRCHDCPHLGSPLGTLLCGMCDDEAHPYFHTHRRECWKSGYFAPVASHQRVVEVHDKGGSTSLDIGA
jgi:hypothetical protein